MRALILAALLLYVAIGILVQTQEYRSGSWHPTERGFTAVSQFALNALLWPIILVLRHVRF